MHRWRYVRGQSASASERLHPALPTLFRAAALADARDGVVTRVRLSARPPALPLGFGERHPAIAKRSERMANACLDVPDSSVVCDLYTKYDI